jgi:hypothetical protein
VDAPLDQYHDEQSQYNLDLGYEAVRRVDRGQSLGLTAASLLNEQHIRTRAILTGAHVPGNSEEEVVVTEVRDRIVIHWERTIRRIHDNDTCRTYRPA